MPDITNTEVFKPFEAFIRHSELSDADLFDILGGIAETSGKAAAAFAYHTRDILSEQGDSELNYTDITVQAYWRTFFSPEFAPKYGSDYMVHWPEQLQAFVDFIVNGNTKGILDVDQTPAIVAH